MEAKWEGSPLPLLCAVSTQIHSPSSSTADVQKVDTEVVVAATASRSSARQDVNMASVQALWARASAAGA